jgi:hypothetical protein
MKLTVIFSNDTLNFESMMASNESSPLGKRTVQIELTAEQIEKLKPRATFKVDGRQVYEKLFDCWIEPPDYA